MDVQAPESTVAVTVQVGFCTSDCGDRADKLLGETAEEALHSTYTFLGKFIFCLMRNFGPAI